MNCREVIKLLGAFADGEIADERMRDTIRAHLSECENCRKEYHLQLSAKSAVSQLGLMAASNALTTRIMAEISQRRRRGAIWRWSYVSAGAAALVAVMILLGLGLFGPYSTADIYKSLPERAPASVVMSDKTMGNDETNFAEFLVSRHEEARVMLETREEWAPELAQIVQRLSSEADKGSLYKELPEDSENEEDEPSADGE